MKRLDDAKPVTGNNLKYKWNHTVYREFWEQVTEIILVSQRKESSEWHHRYIFTLYSFCSQV